MCLPAKQTQLRGTPPFPSDSFPTPSSTSLNYHVCRRLPGGWLLSSQLSTGHFPLTILPVSRAQHGFLPVLQQLSTEQSHWDHALPVSSPSPPLLDGPQPLCRSVSQALHSGTSWTCFFLRLPCQIYHLVCHFFLLRTSFICPFLLQIFIEHLSC